MKTSLPSPPENFKKQNYHINRLPNVWHKFQEISKLFTATLEFSTFFLRRLMFSFSTKKDRKKYHNIKVLKYFL